MTVDLRSIPTQVIIQGSTNLDVSQAFISLSISGNALDDSGWFKPRGQIVLGQLPGFAESFDCRANPGRWAPGTIVAVSVWLGGVWVPLPWRLKILAYPNRPMPGNRTITLEIGTDADLLNYRAPEGDPGNDEYGTPTAAQALINRALSQAGAPSLVTGTEINSLNLSFSPEKNTGGSWITYAGSVAYAARHILWQRTDGGIVAAPVTLEGLTAIEAYTIGTDESDYILEAPGEQPPEVVEVQGTTYQIGTVEDESYVTEDIVDGVLVRTTVSYRDRDTFSPEYEEQVEMPANVVLPLQFPAFTGLITESRVLKTSNYNADSAILESEVEEIYRPVAFVFPGSVWATPQTLIVAERTTVSYTYDSREIMTKRETRREVATISGSTVTTATALVTAEDWIPSQVTLSDAAKVPGEEYFFSRTQVNFDQDTARAPGIRGASTNNTPPETQYRPAEKQRNEVAHTGKATFTNAVGSSFAEKKWVISLPSGMGVSDSQCRAHAALWGKVRQGRQFKIRWSADLTADWLTNFSPIARVDFDLDGLTTAYLAEGFSIEIDQRSAAIGGLGLEIGEVDGAALVPPYVQANDFVVTQSMRRMGAVVSIALDTAANLTQSMRRMGGALSLSLIDSVAIQQTMQRMGGNISIVPVIAVDVVQAMGRMGATVSISSTSTLLDDLLAWYSLGEASGNALDAHTGGYTLTQSGTVGSAAGIIGDSRTGFATGNYFSSSNSIFTRGDTDFYMAFWYYPTSTTTQHILGRYTFTTANRSYFVQFDSSRIQWIVSGNGTAATTANNATTLSINTWNFIEVYHNAATNLIGVAVNGGAFTTAAHSTGLFAGTAGFTIGRIDVVGGGTAVPVVGRVDEVALWSRILTTDERTELYNGGSGLAYPG